MTSSANKNTIIVADNSQTLRLIVKKVLEVKYHVLEADSGTQVVSLVDRTLSNERSRGSSTSDGTLATLITGFELSDGSGLETITKLRGKYDKQELPIILNSTDNRRENIKQAITAGINDYVVIPFPAELLATKVRNRPMCGRCGPQSAAR